LFEEPGIKRGGNVGLVRVMASGMRSEKKKIEGWKVG